jgi:glycosyltransferase involved in cell wall biosynthesis
MCVPDWPPGNSANGIVSYASQMIPALRSLGHDVFILARESCNPQDDPQLSLIKSFQGPLPFWNRALFRITPTNAIYHANGRILARAVEDLVTKQGIEILEIEESFGLSHAISRLGLIPVVVRLHGPWFLNKRFEDTRREWLECRAITAADAVTSPSQHVLESVEQRYGRLRRSLSFANPIVVPAQQWGLSSCDRYNLLFVGRFDLIKGGDLIIDAFGRLAEKSRELKLTFVGPDYGINGIHLVEYARKKLSPDALSRLEYRGQLSSREIERLRPGHFATICASRFEVFPYTVLEAMASGCPVVASDVGGIPEIIRSGQNGMLFRSQSIDCLVSSVQSLLDNPDLAASLGDAARRSVEDYRPEAAAALVAEFYEETIRAFQARR